MFPKYRGEKLPDTGIEKEEGFSSDKKKENRPPLYLIFSGVFFSSGFGGAAAGSSTGFRTRSGAGGFSARLGNDDEFAFRDYDPDGALAGDVQ